MKIDSVFQTLLINILTTSILLFIVRWNSEETVNLPNTLPCHVTNYIYSLPIAFGFIITRYTFIYLIKFYKQLFISKGRLTDFQYELKVERFSHNLYQFLYHLITTIFVYEKLHPFLSVAISNSKLSLIKAPIQFTLLSEVSLDIQQFLQFYFVCTGGFHLAQLLALLTTRYHYFVYFWEICVRISLIAFFLVGGYTEKFIIPGAIILLIHDACDIFSFACKTLADTSYRKSTFFMAIILMIVWAYARIYCLARLIIAPMIQNVEFSGFTTNIESTLILCSLLYLFFMNIYWWGLAIKSCYIFITKGRVEDIHNPHLPKEKEHTS